jgi:polar amino acid transport system substrate-binding protein
MMNWRQAVAIGVASFVAGLAMSGTRSLADPRMDSLVQSGKLRVGLFLPQYVKDPASGELRGVGAHVVSLAVARALAARLRIPVEFIGYRTPPEVIECLKARRCDLGIMGVDPTRAAELSLSPAFMQFDFTHLVPSGSPIQKVADADRPGVRIAVIRKHASTMVLMRMTKHAGFVEAATPAAAFELLRGGRADIFASSRPMLLDYVPQLPGSRVLDDGYGVNLVALAIPKGQDGQLAYISEFLGEMKRSGWMERAIEDAGLQGFQVAP